VMATWRSVIRLFDPAEDQLASPAAR